MNISRFLTPNIKYTVFGACIGGAWAWIRLQNDQKTGASNRHEVPICTAVGAIVGYCVAPSALHLLVIPTILELVYKRPSPPPPPTSINSQF